MRSPENIIYFTNGSIGDFLMVLFLMENIHANAADVRLYIVTPRNEQLFTELLAQYPFVSIIRANRHSLSGLARLWRYRNWCLTPPTPGRLPLATKIIARLLAVRGQLVGFDDGAPQNAFLYTMRIAFDFSKLYCDALLDLLPALGFTRMRERPSFIFDAVPQVLSRYGLTPQTYVVLHPFGSAKVRSILGDELRQLVEYIVRTTEGVQVVISGSSADKMHIPQNLGPRVMVIAGDVSILELATLIKESALYIGVDTGITHLAATLGTKSFVIAHEGAANWLPYYNPNATIMYQIWGDASGLHEGREHLDRHRKGRERYLERVPGAAITNRLSALLAEIG